MLIRYVIEKEIEVPDYYSDVEIEQVINSKCKEENGFDYLWEKLGESPGLLYVSC